MLCIALQYSHQAYLIWGYYNISHQSLLFEAIIIPLCCRPNVLVAIKIIPNKCFVIAVCQAAMLIPQDFSLETWWVFCICVITSVPYLILRPTDVIFLFIYRAVGYISPTSTFNSPSLLEWCKEAKIIVCNTTYILTAFSHCFIIKPMHLFSKYFY